MHLKESIVLFVFLRAQYILMHFYETGWSLFLFVFFFMLHEITTTGAYDK